MTYKIDSMVTISGSEYVALKSEVERLRVGNEDMRHTIHQWEPDKALLRAENDRLRAALEKIASLKPSATDLGYLDLFVEAKIKARAALGGDA